MEGQNQKSDQGKWVAWGCSVGIKVCAWVSKGAEGLRVGRDSHLDVEVISNDDEREGGAKAMN